MNTMEYELYIEHQGDEDQRFLELQAAQRDATDLYPFEGEEVMKFIVRRTSLMFEEQPCEGAVWEHIDGEPNIGEWYYEGELTEFIKEHGTCVVAPPTQYCEEWRVEIYDDYRE